MVEETFKLMFREIVEAMRNGEFDPDEWEKSFLHDMGKKIDRDWLITEKQDEALERIWKKATGKSH